jgi:hypothetical protein
MNPLRFAAAYSDRVRYSASDFDALASGFTARDRWGGDGADLVRRGVLSDWLRDRDREWEADLLADPERHVIFSEGKVVPGTYDKRELNTTLNEIDTLVDDWSEGTHDPLGSSQSTFYTQMGGLTQDLEGPDVEPLPKNHERFWSVSDGWADPESDPNFFVHRSDLGSHFADEIDQNVNGADYGWNTEEEPEEYPDVGSDDYDSRYERSNGEEFDRLLARLRDTIPERPLSPFEYERHGVPVPSSPESPSQLARALRKRLARRSEKVSDLLSGLFRPHRQGPSLQDYNIRVPGSDVNGVLADAVEEHDDDPDLAAKVRTDEYGYDWHVKQVPTETGHSFHVASGADLPYLFDRVPGLEDYLEAALWASSDEDGEPLDRLDGEWHPDSVLKAAKDLRDFHEYVAEALPPEVSDALKEDLTGAAHDFWLSRNGHGAGFFDGDWPHRRALQDAAKTFGGSYASYDPETQTFHLD